MTDNHKRRKITKPGSPTSNKNAEAPETAASDGYISPLSLSDHLNQAAAYSFVNSLEKYYIDQAEVQTDHLNSTPTNEPINEDSNCLPTPIIMNPHENGIHQYPRLRKQQETEESNNHKAHVNFGTAAATKVSFSLFSLIALASNLTIPKHRTNPKSTYTEKVKKFFHEVKYL